jgi:hypothetical protein
MTQSYDRLGLTQLRDDADRVLRSSFRTPRSTRTASATRRRLVEALVSLALMR